MDSPYAQSSNIPDRLWTGYRRVASFAGITLGVGVFAVAVSLVIVLPLWLLATRFPTVYSAVVAASVGGLILLLTVRAIRSDGGRRLRIFAIRAFLAVILIAAGYLVAVLVAVGNLLLGVPFGIALVLAVGYVCGGGRS